jgi:hypothetical protein
MPCLDPKSSTRSIVFTNTEEIRKEGLGTDLGKRVSAAAAIFQ